MKKVYTKPTVVMMQLHTEEKIAACNSVYTGANGPPNTSCKYKKDNNTSGYSC